MEQGLLLRRGTLDDAPRIAALLRRSFPDNPKGDLDVLLWQYWQSPFGPPVVWLWEDRGEVVGHYTVIRYAGRLDGRPATLGVGVDAAVDPAYQGRRLFGPMAARLYADSADQGIAAVLCYPNDSSVRGIGRVGWRELGLLRTHLLPLEPAWFARRLHLPGPVVGAVLPLLRRRAPAGIQVQEDAAPDPRADGLWRQREATVGSGVVRDLAWLTWRYVQRPGGGYRYFAAQREGVLVGVAVTTERAQGGGRFAYLLELVAGNGRVARALVAAVARSSPGCAGLVLATLPGSDLSRRARQAGLHRVPPRLEDKQLHVGTVGPCSSRWSLQWGDLDHL